MKNLFGALQWIAFMVASSIVAPIAIADLFGLTGHEAAEFVQRTIFVLGVAGVIQVTCGHRLPINEGPAGLWWGVFALYASFSTTLFASGSDTLRALQTALIASGILFIILSAAGLIKVVSRLFTPVVMGIYLLLLVVQLSKSFLNGMLGLGYTGNKADLKIAGLSLLTVLITFYVTKHKKESIRRYGVLISLACGWLLFAVCGAAKKAAYSPDQLFSLPKLFAFGSPKFNSGMIMTAVFVTLLLLTNMIASIRLAEMAMDSIKPGEGKANLKSAGMAAGINQILGGVFSAVGPVPISGAAGFIAATRMTSRLPFLLGSILIAVSSFFPQVMAIFTAVPIPVGYSVTFVVFTGMLGMAFAEFEKEKEQNRIRTVIGVSLLSGVGLMFVPAAAFQGLPPIIVSLLNNGLVFGSLVSICADQWTKIVYRRKARGEA
ncbi:Xanthine/uracil permease [Bacillus sp. OV322]|uniref:purine/pyrimidine permease n=1 Tax=Bacillus sp. OV322 TaxID=1882764 RepID=UPI0008E8F8D0|nr:purine/pyrimidine permease [Bacillus sp. OV322]SFC64099.1 Xanthine/uracil permease [Bacillus sp. OV322]